MTRRPPAGYPALQYLQSGRVSKLETDLNHIVGPGALDQNVFDLIKWAESTGRTEDLIRAIQNARPLNQEVQAATAAVLLPPPMASVGPIWNVPHPTKPRLHGPRGHPRRPAEAAHQRGRTALAQAISGLGGIGKTQTAVEYAYRYRDKYQAVLWLNAESPLALKAGCGELARLMHLPHPEDDLDQAVLALKHWLETQPGWLLVLDNADDPAMLKPFLPDAEHGHILITSRAQDFQDLGILDPVELPKLPVDGRDRIPPPSVRPRGCRGRGTRRRRASSPASWTGCRSPWSKRRPTSWRDEERPSDAISKAIAAVA